MNIKFVVVGIIILVVTSCKREYTASFSPSHKSSSVVVPNQLSEIDNDHSTAYVKTTTGIAIPSSKKNRIKVVDKLNDFSRVKQEEKIASPFFLQTKKEIKKSNQINKERDPRYSRALIMTIFGGLATGLGILAMNVAPTGLLVFIFGLIFIIGVVSLIMYWANPRPKM